jgi:cobaltochelatase CobS
VEEKQMTTNNNAAQVTTIVQPIFTDFNARTLQPIDAVFGEEYVSDGLQKIFVRTNRHSMCKQSNPTYVPDAKVLKTLMQWWNHSHGVKPLMPFGLYGETGTGKTEMFLYLCDKTNEPFVIEKMTECMTADQLEGNMELIVDDNGNQVTSRVYSMLAQAYKYGWTVLVDEIDKVSPQVGAALHLLLERKPWPLSVFKETIFCHKNFRLVATANTLGEGGHDRYSSSNRMDAALRSRIGWQTVGFPEPQHEIEILRQPYPAIPTILRSRMVKTANAFRDALLGPDRNGSIDDPLNCVFSTRTLVNWADHLMCFGKDGTSWDAFMHTFKGSVDPEEMNRVEAIFQLIWKQDFKTKSLGQEIEDINAGK